MADEKLADDVHEEIARLSEEGNRYLDAGLPESAIGFWIKALELVPSPQKNFEAAMWLHASIGEAFRVKNDHEVALSHFQSAANSADGNLNPFVLLSLGATLFDLGRKAEATDPLIRAYMLEGGELFEEYGGPYLDYLRQNGLIN